MKKDIIFHKIQDVAVAIIPEEDKHVGEVWNAYLINLKEDAIDGVIVSTRGYGNVDGKQVKTSVLRHIVGKMEAKKYKKLEPLHKQLLSLSNEFWVSFWYKGAMREKKYIFVPETIIDDNYINIPLIGKQGVMIK